MRLSRDQVDLIKEIVRKHCGIDARVWLFGSRVDDAAKGGDIDLLVEVAAPIRDARKCEDAIVLDMWKAMGEQKIDLVLVDEQSRSQSIHSIARETGVLL